MYNNLIIKSQIMHIEITIGIICVNCIYSYCILQFIISVSKNDAVSIRKKVGMYGKVRACYQSGGCAVACGPDGCSRNARIGARPDSAQG